MKYNPPLKKSVKPKTKGVSFSFWKTYYVDNAPYLFLNQQDIESASRLITKLFKWFGLTVHAGNKNEKTTSKTEAMYFPKPREKADPENTADIRINED